jgi:hypothetical protein
LEAVEIEAAIEAQRMEAELKKQQVEWERWIRKRQAQQRKLDDYYSEKERLQAETERQDRERLMKLHLDKTKQALQDKERVEYRQREYTKKVHAKEQVARQAVELAEAKEQDLERIREKVRVIVESDPIRMMKSTEASAAKVSGGSKKELDLQQPLFPLHGYTDQEVTCDLRFKVTAALREANLLQTDYAKKILASIKPSHTPRRDQESSLFK